MKPIALTGIKPTGSAHIGNFLVMIRPALELVKEYQALYFIADAHALTTLPEAGNLHLMVYDIAATWMALGLDPNIVIFFRQSDIAEVFEMAWILACFTPKGLLNRAHAYKAAVEANRRRQKNADADINAGLFQYPVLMAADILLYGSRVVPVGSDQKQHVEIAREIALAVNRRYGRVLAVPGALIRESTAFIPGVDGRKMSKNYNNTIPIFADSDTLRRRVMAIVTDSRRPEDPKDPETCNVFALYRHFADPQHVEARRRQYLGGGLAYSDIKQELFELLETTFRRSRRRYRELLGDRGALEDVLRQGAERARAIAVPILKTLRHRIGLGKQPAVVRRFSTERKS